MTKGSFTPNALRCGAARHRESPQRSATGVNAPLAYNIGLKRRSHRIVISLTLNEK